MDDNSVNYSVITIADIALLCAGAGYSVFGGRQRCTKRLEFRMVENFHFAFTKTLLASSQYLRCHGHSSERNLLQMGWLVQDFG